MQCTSQSKRLYRVLTPEDREEIMTGRHRGESIRSIARRLDRNPSVISREIKNNSAEDYRYQAYWANSRLQIRRRQSRKRERISDPVIREYVIEKLELGWSPRKIAGRIEIDLPGKSISHETIYMYMGTSKKPYFVFGLIFFLAATLSKCSRKQVRTAGAKLRGTHRQTLKQVCTATRCVPQGVARGTHRHRA